MRTLLNHIHIFNQKEDTHTSQGRIHERRRSPRHSTMLENNGGHICIV